MMKVVRVSEWNQFVQLTDALPGWAFRGELSAQWPLVTSVSRRLQTYCPEKALWPLREERASRVFRRKAHVYLNNSAALDDTLRCLALMQHHGAPTRLLDFTKSPYVAAFFALEDAMGDAAVYALNTPALWSAAPRSHPTLTRDYIDPRHTGTSNAVFSAVDGPSSGSASHRRWTAVWLHSQDCSLCPEFSIDPWKTFWKAMKPARHSSSNMCFGSRCVPRP